MLLYVIVFILGACLGSFYHVVGYRMPKQENWIVGRSCCPTCKTVLSGLELIPLVSYGIQRGKCSSCKATIRPIYFGVELVSGLLFVLPVYVYGVEGEQLGQVLLAWAFLSLLLVITVSDIYYQVILDKVLIFFGGVLVLVVASYPQFSFSFHLAGAVLGFFMMYGIYGLGWILFKHEAVGGGDIKLYAVVGWVLGGSTTVLSLFVASFIALLYSVFFLKERTQMIPFGPFIAIAAYFCLFWG